MTFIQLHWEPCLLEYCEMITMPLKMPTLRTEGVRNKSSRHTRITCTVDLLFLMYCRPVQWELSAVVMVFDGYIHLSSPLTSPSQLWMDFTSQFIRLLLNYGPNQNIWKVSDNSESCFYCCCCFYIWPLLCIMMSMQILILESCFHIHLLNGQSSPHITCLWALFCDVNTVLKTIIMDQFTTRKINFTNVFMR